MPRNRRAVSGAAAAGRTDCIRTGFYPWLRAGQGTRCEGDLCGRAAWRPNAATEVPSKEGERVLILMGVIVTGDSARGLMRLVTAAGGQGAGGAVLVDRSSIPPRLGVAVEPPA